jgi:hypothetical protein
MTIDNDSVMPYERGEKYERFKVDEIKYEFEYEKEATSTETAEEEAPGDAETGPLVVKVTRKIIHIISKEQKKITLKVYYSQSVQEDAEHFFEAFEKMQKELASVGLRNFSQNKETDVKIYFEAFDQMLGEPQTRSGTTF